MNRCCNLLSFILFIIYDLVGSFSHFAFFPEPVNARKGICGVDNIFQLNLL